MESVSPASSPPPSIPPESATIAELSKDSIIPASPTAIVLQPSTAKTASPVPRGGEVMEVLPNELGSVFQVFLTELNCHAARLQEACQEFANNFDKRLETLRAENAELRRGAGALSELEALIPISRQKQATSDWEALPFVSEGRSVITPVPVEPVQQSSLVRLCSPFSSDNKSTCSNGFAEGKAQGNIDLESYPRLQSTISTEEPEFPSVAFLMDLDRTQHWKRFCTLDPDGGGSITASDLVDWMAMDDPERERGPDDVPLLEELIEEFNQKLLVQSLESEITFDSFCYLMCDEFMSEKMMSLLEQPLYDSMYELRSLMADKSEKRRAASFIANRLNMRRTELKDEMAKQMSMSSGVSFHIAQYIEPASSIVIVTNALILGVQADVNQDWKGWTWLECCFAFFYVAEIIFKLKIDGVHKYFSGTDCLWNYFDITIVAAALAELGSTLLKTVSAGELGNLTLIRMARLARLSRLLRLLKLKIFKELKLMVAGILGGFRVLMWAIILFALIVYTLSLVLRLTIGSWEPPENCLSNLLGDHSCPKSTSHLMVFHRQLFSSMPRTMLTVFRCFIQGCESVDGSPLIPHLFETHGWLLLSGYVLASFFVIFGVFNVMTAIFVEQTSEASRLEKVRNSKKTTESVKIAVKLQRVVLKICGIQSRCSNENKRTSETLKTAVQGFFRGSVQPTESESDRTEEAFRSISGSVTREKFMNVMNYDYEVRDMLEELDIYIGDPQGFFELLDANGTGKLEPSEMISGFMNLRGMKEQSYQVASLLGIRALQSHVRHVHNLLRQTIATIRRVESGPPTPHHRPRETRRASWAAHSRITQVASGNGLQDNGSA